MFFVEDKAMRGWSVVLKKETRSRRIGNTEEEHGLGQEECRDDMLVLRNMEIRGGGASDEVGGHEAPLRQTSGRRRNWNEVG